MGSRSGFDSNLDFDELTNVVDRGSGAVSAATRQANALVNFGMTVTLTELNALHSIVVGKGVLETYQNAGATLALTAASNGKTIVLDTAAGSVVTLPAATGAGTRFKFVVGTLATSNSHILYTDGGNAGAGTGVFKGIISGVRVDSGNAVLAFVSSANDTITLNRTTTGSVTIGEWFEVVDAAANVWHVRGMLSATGAAFATPFSTT